MLTSSICTAPLWRQIPHGERVSWLHAADKVMTALHTLRQQWERFIFESEKGGKKHDFTQKVPRVPINPSHPCSEQGWRPAAGWQWSMLCPCNSFHSHLQQSWRPQWSMCLD